MNDVVPAGENPPVPFPVPGETQAVVHQHRDGFRAEFTFPNGWGASVIRVRTEGFGGSYGASMGLFELAALLDGEVAHVPEITGDTDDFIGWLSPEDVAELLHRIAAMPPADA